MALNPTPALRAEFGDAELARRAGHGGGGSDTRGLVGAGVGAGPGDPAAGQGSTSRRPDRSLPPTWRGVPAQTDDDRGEPGSLLGKGDVAALVQRHTHGCSTFPSPRTHSHRMSLRCLRPEFNLHGVVHCPNRKERGKDRGGGVSAVLQVLSQRGESHSPAVVVVDGGRTDVEREMCGGERVTLRTPRPRPLPRVNVQVAG